MKTVKILSPYNQAIVGEMSVDEAFGKIGADMTDAVKQAQK